MNIKVDCRQVCIRPDLGLYESGRAGLGPKI